MIQKIKKIALSVATLLILGVPTLVPMAVHADSLGSACEGLTLADPSATCDATKAKDGFSNIIKNVINVLSIIGGAVAVVMIVIGGLRYVFSGGDSNGLSGAKNTILYAIVGLVIILFAQTIVKFVLTKVSEPPKGGTSATSSSTGTGNTTPTDTNANGKTSSPTTPAPTSDSSGGD